MSNGHGEVEPEFYMQLEKMAETKARTDLRHGGTLPRDAAHRAAIDEWLQEHELRRVFESLASMRRMAKWTMWAAIAAFATATLSLVALIIRRCH